VPVWQYRHGIYRTIEGSAWKHSAHARTHAPKPFGPLFKTKSTNRSLQISVFSNCMGAQTVEIGKIEATIEYPYTRICRSSPGQVVHKDWGFSSDLGWSLRLLHHRARARAVTCRGRPDWADSSTLNHHPGYLDSYMVGLVESSFAT
jgi:hypothetical protein